ncbi:hypothetical protein M501DRAFT_1007010 [Patellaria atrata CBS 101060]|uniref:DUF6606 domain-containing protein n=1 Tax=Patellaria atrata CBS 101060 TaxID=1346257 RepID=A0A9P4VL53_9PEZI|nr:hypothetical protein M501DRAFT_1007010 [Patellaria atrata CBS 101060]
MASLNLIFNHLVLPPKLPEQADPDPNEVTFNILGRITDACETLRQLTGNEQEEIWATVADSVRICSDLNQDSLIFEAFEASPDSEHVLAAEGALQWDFPGRTAELPIAESQNTTFQETLATFLEQASMESLIRFAARSLKANTSIIESQNTTDPALVTQMLMRFLEALGSSIDVVKLRKRVRDSVSIDRAELPWRRSPFWLIMRVAIHTFYKFFIFTVLTQLFCDCVSQISSDMTTLVKAKLCRRLAKLKIQRSHATSTIYEQLFSYTTPFFSRTIENVTEQRDIAWTKFKSSIVRRIPRLPSRADEQSLQLSLPNSGKCLSDVLFFRSTGRPTSTFRASIFTAVGEEAIQNFTSRYYKLANLETKVEHDRAPTPESASDCQSRCAYDNSPEQISIFLLNLFDKWVQMDLCAVKACHLLLDYHPVFIPELLDVLQLPTFRDMERLQHIQRYLQERSANCRLAQLTILSEPSTECFALRYTEHSAELCNLRRRIEDASDRAREQKEREWSHSTQEYDSLSEKIENLSCTCKIKLDGSRDVHGCKKCWYFRCRKRLRITVHEDYLSQDAAQKAAVVFELQIPGYLAAYRNVTWRIIRDFGHPAKPNKTSPAMLLNDYSQLQGFLRVASNSVCLASMSKSFLQTHFKAIKMKAPVSKVLFPLGLDQLDRLLTFQHLYRLHVLRGLNSIIPQSTHPATSVDGPSSYEIIASQTKCSSDLSVHEFMSYQRLLSGYNRRWPTMLVESGASNLNFSNESTMYVLSQLAVQAGPASQETAKKLLNIARKITLQWVSSLLQRMAHYGLWAALPCRRTFSTFAETGNAMDADHMCSFVEASLALRDNLMLDIEKLPQSLKTMLVRDTKFGSKMEEILRRSIDHHPESVATAFNKS